MPFPLDSLAVFSNQSFTCVTLSCNQVYDPFHNVRAGGTKERRLFRRAMMGEYDHRKFPEQPKLTREEMQVYIKQKKKDKDAKLNIKH
jgi:hypothetical protein